MKGHNYGLCRKCGKTHINPKGMLGKKGWNNGLTKENNISVKSISLKLTGRPKTVEHKKELSLSKKKYFSDLENRKAVSKRRKTWSSNHTSVLKGKPRSEKDKLSISEGTKKAMMNAEIRERCRIGAFHNPGTNKNTNIEILFQKELDKQNIYYEKHKVLLNKYQVDIIIPDKKLIIECDGEYWHNYPIGSLRDRIRDEELTRFDYKVLRFWGKDIKNNISRCMKQVVIYLNG